MDGNQEIVIPRWLWVIAVVVTLAFLGAFTSPKDAEGRPIFLSPEVKAISDYRNSAVAWLNELRQIDASVTNILSGAYGLGIFEKSRQSQAVAESAFWLLREIEKTETPTAASPLREAAYRTSLAYLDAARATLVWTSEPNDENLGAAQSALDAARDALRKLERSEWLLP